MEIQAIETIYKGYRFRSRLEARWAVLFDELGINWIYEPEGYVFEDGTTYLPDFFLPDCKAFFEVKGVMSDKDMHKLSLLGEHSKKDVIVGNSDFYFYFTTNYDGWLSVFPQLKECDNYDGSGKKCRTRLGKCFNCGEYFFYLEEGSWVCRCCGAYDGKNHFTHDVAEFGSDVYKKAVEKAKQARFEHGETPEKRR